MAKRPILPHQPTVALSLLLAFAVLGRAGAAEPPPSACPDPRAHAFDFWLGDWNVLNRGLQSDGTWQVTGHATARIVPVLDGCAVLEHWLGTAWGRKTLGFSVRAWDPAREAWVLVLSWPGGGQPGFGELEGTFRHGRGEFFSEGTGSDGRAETTRYSFADIAADRLRWDAARSSDGARWLTYWSMEFSRRPKEAPPLYQGPWIMDGRPRACPGDEVAALDFLAGSWRGTETIVGADGRRDERRVRLEVLPILEGCAQMDREWGAAGEERFAMRAWAAVRQRWVEYSLRRAEPGFVRAEGAVSPDGAALGVAGTDDGLTRRIVWRRDGPGIERREERREERRDVETWRLVRRLSAIPTFYGDLEP